MGSAVPGDCAYDLPIWGLSFSSSTSVDWAEPAVICLRRYSSLPAPGMDAAPGQIWLGNVLTDPVGPWPSPAAGDLGHHLPSPGKLLKRGRVPRLMPCAGEEVGQSQGTLQPARGVNPPWNDSWLVIPRSLVTAAPCLQGSSLQGANTLRS